MSDETKIEATEVVQKTRRSVVKTAAQVAVTAPAVGLILSAGLQPAAAQTLYGSKNTGTAHDDPNHNEDVDAIHEGTNTNIFNGTQMVDDHVG